MEMRKGYIPMSATDFFKMKYSGFTMFDASKATGIAYSTILDIVRHRQKDGAKVGKVKRLEEWSRGAIDPHGACISTVRTFDLYETGLEEALDFMAETVLLMNEPTLGRAHFQQRMREFIERYRY